MKKNNRIISSVLCIAMLTVFVTACGDTSYNSNGLGGLYNYYKDKKETNVDENATENTEQQSDNKKETYVDTGEDDTVKTVLAEAEKISEGGDYLSALLAIRKAIDEYGECPEYNNAFNAYVKLYKEQLFTEVDTLLSSGNYLDALDKIQGAEKIIGGDEEVTGKRIECEDAYVDDVVEKIEELSSDNKEAAESIINEALKILPQNKTLLDLQESINERGPQKLLSVCPPYETNNYACEGSYMIAGESYHNGFDLDIGHQDSYVIFNMGGKYQTLEFDLGHIDDTSMRSAKFDIYLDEEVVDTILADAEDLPKHHVIELNGAQQLKIVNAEVASGCAHYAFVDCLLYSTEISIKSKSSNEIDNNKLITKICPPYETDGYACEDTYEVAGELYYNGFDFNIYSNAYAIYNLGGKYKTFEFDLGHVDGTSMHLGKFDFYLDGEVVDTVMLNADSLPKHFVIDLKGAKQLKIVSVESSFWSSHYAFLNAVIY